ncbi:MAG TPA: endonuclease/exonuclease/phosphatase family protein, partial [Candidatus Nanopelagicales bacterium]|nr:endonuclease/exonuclease/phosphatase family protein [Candidatus Nanopelagicales bacterium]
RRLRVAFWNVQNLFEPRAVERGPKTPAELDAKLNALSRVVNRLFSGEGPDLIGFAEIQSPQLLNRLKSQLDGSFVSAWVGPGLPGEQTGLGVLARSDTVSRLETLHHYTPLLFARPRCCVRRCTLRSNAEPILFVVNHWKSRRPAMVSGVAMDEEDRRQTARWLGEILAKNDRETCAIVIGDFNAEPFEGPFSELSLRAVRTFGAALWKGATPAYLYNTSWRQLPESDFWETARKTDYRSSQPRTSHDTRPGVIYDQLLVSSAALRGGPVTLLEKSVQYHCDRDTSIRDRSGALTPFRWRYEGNSPGGEGTSDHFPLVAKFCIHRRRSP